MVNQIKDNNNSLTLMNDRDYIYRINKAYAYNTEHELKILQTNNVHQDLIDKECIQMLTHMYYDYIQTVIFKEEYAEQQKAGLAYYYNNVFKKFSTRKVTDVENIIEFHKVITENFADDINKLYTKYVPMDFLKLIEEIDDLKN